METNTTVNFTHTAATEGGCHVESFQHLADHGHAPLIIKATICYNVVGRANYKRLVLMSEGKSYREGLYESPARRIGVRITMWIRPMCVIIRCFYLSIPSTQMSAPAFGRVYECSEKAKMLSLTSIE
jgi:hypothetical protein